METETKTRTTARKVLRVTFENPDLFSIGVGFRLAQRHYVDRDELQAIVQAAYDDHGILADPFLNASVESLDSSLVWDGDQA